MKPKGKRQTVQTVLETVEMAAVPAFTLTQLFAHSHMQGRVYRLVPAAGNFKRLNHAPRKLDAIFRVALRQGHYC